MARKILERSPLLPYHICNRSTDKVPYPVNLDLMWEECSDLLRILSWSFGAQIHAFVLMNNHYHLLLTTPDENIDACVRYFQSELSKWVGNQTAKKSYGFGTRYRWSIIKEASYFVNVYRYIYQNPIRAGLCKKAEDYKWSTFAGISGEHPLKVPLYPSEEFGGALPNVTDSLTELVNSLFSPEETEKIRRGLRRFVFNPPHRLFNTKSSVERYQVSVKSS